MRRFTFRTDGFVSVRSRGEGVLVTKPITFAGSKLSLNIASKSGTRIQVQDQGGKPLPGFALDDCKPIAGDFIEHVVRWRSAADLSQHAGRPVRLRVVMNNADLYSIRFW